MLWLDSDPCRVQELNAQIHRKVIRANLYFFSRGSTAYSHFPDKVVGRDSATDRLTIGGVLA